MRIKPNYNQSNEERFVGKIHHDLTEASHKKIRNIVFNAICDAYDGITGKDNGKTSSKSVEQKQTSSEYVWSNPISRTTKMTKRCTVFASFSEDGSIPEYVCYYLKALCEVSDYVIFVADNCIKEKSEISKLSDCVDYAIFKRHGGYDFGSWRIGINTLIKNKIYDKFDQIVLANDSCYGPVFPFKSYFEDMDNRDCDFWGFIDNQDTRYHILSFFMVFKNKIVRDGSLTKFLNNLPTELTSHEAIFFGERELTMYLSDYKSAVFLHDLCQENMMGVLAGNGNSTVWPCYSLKMKIPLVKVKSLTGLFENQLYENRFDALEMIKQENVKLWEIICGDLKRRNNEIEQEKIDFNFSDITTAFMDKKVVSFDVFDTLLIRPFVHPINLFKAIEFDHGLVGFAESRVKAEAKARLLYSGVEEVTIDEIYSIIEPKYRDCKKIELDYEMKSLHMNPRIKKIYDAAKKNDMKIICISDTYLPGEIIHEVLSNYGFDIDAVFSSADLRKTKGSGNIYRCVIDKLGIETKDIIHIGDNMESDYNIPHTLGIDAYHVPKIVDWFVQLVSNAKYSGYWNGQSLPDSQYISLMSEYYANADCTENFWEWFGYSYGGPLVLYYVNYICINALKNGIDELLFVARDGYILKKIYDEFFYDIYGIQSRYVYLNRQTVFSSMIIDADLDDLKIDVLECFKHQIPSIESEAKMSVHEKYYKYKLEMKKISETKRENLKHHIEANCSGFSKIATVDMYGANMTSLKAAKALLGDKLAMGFFFITSHENPLCYSSASMRNIQPNETIIIILSELLVSSPEEPIMYIGDDGKPVYNPGIRKGYNYDFVERGIVSYCSDYIGKYGYNIRKMINIDEWMELMKHYIMNINDIDRYAFSKITISRDSNAKNLETLVSLLDEAIKEGF